MRLLFCIAWLILPVLGFAWHYGPGQDCFRGDEAQIELVKARAAAKDDNHAVAVKHYANALKSLPAGQTKVARQIRLEKAKSMMLSKNLAEANGELETLVDELSEDKTADVVLLNDAKSALANSQYYTTWTMRLHGFSRDAWEPEIEAARQSYRWLSETAKMRGDTDAAKKFAEDCEASIRLARLDLAELQGLPLPCQ